MKDYDLDIKVKRDRFGKIVSGLALGEILHQNQAIIISIRQGDLKASPSIGVGLEDYLLSHDLSGLQREIRQQMELDGQRVNQVQVTSRLIILDAKY